jgi:hypothetical protein
MIAANHTQAMLDWWAATGVDRVDLAVRRSSGAMLWQRDRAIATLPLAWVRAENVQHADIYGRPARGHGWPLVFVDDVAVDRAHAVAREVDALLVETSPEGGCHVWLRCDRALTEDERKRVQHTWIVALGSDPGSVSGEHLGRLAGFKNCGPHARAGQRRLPRHHAVWPRLGVGLYTPGALILARHDLCASGRPRPSTARSRC